MKLHSKQNLGQFLKNIPPFACATLSLAQATIARGQTIDSNQIERASAVLRGGPTVSAKEIPVFLGADRGLAGGFTSKIPGITNEPTIQERLRIRGELASILFKKDVRIIYLEKDHDRSSEDFINEKANYWVGTGNGFMMVEKAGERFAHPFRISPFSMKINYTASSITLSSPDDPTLGSEAVANKVGGDLRTVLQQTALDIEDSKRSEKTPFEGRKLFHHMLEIEKGGKSYEDYAASKGILSGVPDLEKDLKKVKTELEARLVHYRTLLDSEIPSPLDDSREKLEKAVPSILNLLNAGHSNFGAFTVAAWRDLKSGEAAYLQLNEDKKDVTSAVKQGIHQLFQESDSAAFAIENFIETKRKATLAKETPTPQTQDKMESKAATSEHQNSLWDNVKTGALYVGGAIAGLIVFFFGIGAAAAGGGRSSGSSGGLSSTDYENPITAASRESNNPITAASQEWNNPITAMAQELRESSLEIPRAYTPPADDRTSDDIYQEMKDSLSRRGLSDGQSSDGSNCF